MKTQSTAQGNKVFPKYIKRLTYILVVVLLFYFLYNLGLGPWIVALENWRILLLMTIAAGFGVSIQAMSFNSICSVSDYSVSLTRLFTIWAAAAVVSLVAPIFAGITARTAALVKLGIPWRECLGASFIQVALGVETALITGSISFLFIDWEYSTTAACFLFAAWLLICTASLLLRSDRFKSVKYHKVAKLVGLLTFERKPIVYFWFFMQIVSMSTIYFIGFNGIGGAVSVAECVSLAAVTVLISVLVFLPNGLGVLDLFWVFIAQKSNLSLDEGVAVAILFRLSNFLAALLVITLMQFAHAENEKPQS